MNTSTLAVTAFACLALVAVTPATAATRDGGQPVSGGQALYPETVPGAGLGGVAGAEATLTHRVLGHGAVPGARFSIDIGRSSTVTYVDAARGFTFRALHVGSVRFADNTATLRGTGLVNGRRVSFTVFAVHNAQPGVDLFHIAWLHGASLGGRVLSGSLFIR